MIREDMLIFVDSSDNNNKFYHMKMDEQQNILIEYGRVGNRPQKTSKRGEREYNKILNSKLKKGYTKSEISLTSNTSNNNLLDIAMSQINHSGNEVKDLIQRLVDANIHSITSSTNISFNKDTNGFTTPLGPVTKNGIIKAKETLIKISKLLEKGINLNLLLNNSSISKNKNTKSFIELNEIYFRIIPTKIKNLRNKNEYMLIDPSRIDTQYTICDTLEETLELMKDETSSSNKNVGHEEVFKVDLNILKDKKEFQRLENYYESSKKNMHGRNINNSKIINIFSVNLSDEEKVYRQDLNNQMELFHGTKAVNLLSILKSGLLMPKETPGSICGAMYGHGLYFASNSSKSQQYCAPAGYQGSFNNGDIIYMFIADVALGNYEIPKSWHSKTPSKGYDSFWAKANQSGIMNDEMIVFNKNQVRLKYILEIKI